MLFICTFLSNYWECYDWRKYEGFDSVFHRILFDKSDEKEILELSIQAEKTIFTNSSGVMEIIRISPKVLASLKCLICPTCIRSKTP